MIPKYGQTQEHKNKFMASIGVSLTDDSIKKQFADFRFTIEGARMSDDFTVLLVLLTTGSLTLRINHFT